jgi:DNA-binding response OmpR family regulator
VSATKPALRSGSQPRVLVVDDDRRVRELLEVALTAHGFAVLTAVDGEDAVQCAQRERPDLVILDVRLPKRSGFEVCDTLRSDPVDPTVPIVLVSAAAETEQRLHAFSRGADDYLAKPFSPKELIARVRRLLTRSEEARAAVRRAQDLEREMASAKREARRAGEDRHRDRALLELTVGLGRDLFGCLELDEFARRLLAAVTARLGTRAAALLVRAEDGGLRAWSARGELFERVAALTIPADGELARLLTGLGRPVSRLELERTPALRRELQALVAGGWTLLTPLLATRRLEGVLLTSERPDGALLPDDGSAWLATLCDLSGVALRNALDARGQASAMLELVAPTPPDALAAAALDESRRLLARASRALAMSPRDRDGVALALAFGAVWSPDRMPAVLDRLKRDDPSGLARDVAARLARARVARDPRVDEDPEARETLLLRTLGAYIALRRASRSPDDARAQALASSGADGDSSIAHALLPEILHDLGPPAS